MAHVVRTWQGERTVIITIHNIMKMKNASEESQAIHSTKQHPLATNKRKKRKKKKKKKRREIRRSDGNNGKQQRMFETFFQLLFSFSNKFILFISLLELNKFRFCVSVISSLWSCSVYTVLCARRNSSNSHYAPFPCTKKNIFLFSWRTFPLD